MAGSLHAVLAYCPLGIQSDCTDANSIAYAGAAARWTRSRLSACVCVPRMLRCWRRLGRGAGCAKIVLTRSIGIVLGKEVRDDWFSCSACYHGRSACARTIFAQPAPRPSRLQHLPRSLNLFRLATYQTGATSRAHGVAAPGAAWARRCAFACGVVRTSDRFGPRRGANGASLAGARRRA